MNDERGLVWRAYWPMVVLALTFLAVVLLFGAYLTVRQQVANDRAERQRRAICAILANIPGHIPPEIVRARTVFARPGHPGDCQPISRPKPKPSPRPTPTATATVVVTRSLPQPTATATVSVTPRPTPTRSPRPSSSPTPKPSPSRTCLPMTRICT